MKDPRDKNLFDVLDRDKKCDGCRNKPYINVNIGDTYLTLCSKCFKKMYFVNKKRVLMIEGN